MTQKEIKDALIDINEKISETKKKIERAQSSELDSLESDLQNYIAKGNELVGMRKAQLSSLVLDTNERDQTLFKRADELEARGRDLKVKDTEVRIPIKEIMANQRAALTTTSAILPTFTANQINPYPFRTVSRLVDQVNWIYLNGGNELIVPFEKATPTGDFTAEASDYHEDTPTFDNITIGRGKITIYFEISEEMIKLPALDYQNFVIGRMREALYKKIGQEIIAGTGVTNNSFIGIIGNTTDATNKCIPTSSDLAFADNAITTDFFTDVETNYGGDEDIEGGLSYILSKGDFAALRKLKDGNDRPYYDYDFINNTLDTRPIIINSKLASSATQATAGGYFGVYGNPKAYTVAVFSDIDLRMSDQYKFKQGVVAYRASIICGGNTTSYLGLQRLKQNKISAGVGG